MPSTALVGSLVSCGVVGVLVGASVMGAELGATVVGLFVLGLATGDAVGILVGF